MSITPQAVPNEVSLFLLLLGGGLMVILVMAVVGLVVILRPSRNGRPLQKESSIAGSNIDAWTEAGRRVQPSEDES